jgi:hypothetical protein
MQIGAASARPKANTDLLFIELPFVQVQGAGKAIEHSNKSLFIKPDSGGIDNDVRIDRIQ